MPGVPGPERSRRLGGIGALAAWVVLLVAVLAGARRLAATDVLSPPPVGGPEQLAAWASERDPVAATFALLALVVAVAAAALLAMTVLGVVARLVRAGRLVSVLDLFTVPVVRRLLSSAIGVGLAGAAAAGPAAAGVAVTAGTGPTHASVPVDRFLVDRLGVVRLGVDRLGVDRLVVAEPDVTREVDGRAPPTMERLDEPAMAVAAAEVTLVPGDHLWATAAAALTSAWGRPPSDAEVAPYWDRLVAANRDRLPDPANPDLVLPGLTVVVPPVPPSP